MISNGVIIDDMLLCLDGRRIICAYVCLGVLNQKEEGQHETGKSRHQTSARLGVVYGPQGLAWFCVSYKSF